MKGLEFFGEAGDCLSRAAFSPYGIGVSIFLAGFHETRLTRAIERLPSRPNRDSPQKHGIWSSAPCFRLRNRGRRRCRNRHGQPKSTNPNGLRYPPLAYGRPICPSRFPNSTGPHSVVRTRINPPVRIEITPQGRGDHPRSLKSLSERIRAVDELSSFVHEAFQVFRDICPASPDRRRRDRGHRPDRNHKPIRSPLSRGLALGKPKKAFPFRR